MGARTIGKQVQLLFLDTVLHVSSGTAKLLVERQITVTFVVAMKIGSLPMSVQGIIGGIKVQDDLPALARDRFDPFGDEQLFNLLGLGLDLTIALIAPTGSQLQTIERRSSRQCLVAATSSGSYCSSASVTGSGVTSIAQRKIAA